MRNFWSFLKIIVCILMILTFSFYGCRKEIARIEETAPAEEEEKKEIKEQEIEKPEEVGETIETRAEGLTSKDPDTATMNDLKDAIELASEAQEAGLDDIAEDLISWAKEALSVIASQALLKSPCDAEMGDIKNAVEIASEAQKLGLDELADRLLSWARNSLRSIASRSIDSGASEKERFDLAQTAQELGLDDLADDILEGREITPVYTYGVHAELKGIHPYTEITYHFIVDAYTCEQDVHFGWNGKILWKTIGFDGSSSTSELAVSFDADGVVTWPWEEGSVEIGAKIIDENTIVFTLVIRAPGVPDWVLPFSPAEIKQGALANSD